MASRYKLWYETVVRQDLLAKMQYSNVHQVPKVKKITLSAATNVTSGGLNHPVAAAFALELISGQRPQLTRVRVSNARYKVRAGFLEGAKVVLQGEQMYDFMDRLVTHVMPRITEFNGLKNRSGNGPIGSSFLPIRECGLNHEFSLRSFDGRGNFAIGIRDWGYFPEIDAQHSTLSSFQVSCALQFFARSSLISHDIFSVQLKSARGLGILINTTASTDLEAKLLLSALRFPFEKLESK